MVFKVCNSCSTVPPGAVLVYWPSIHFGEERAKRTESRPAGAVFLGGLPSSINQEPCLTDMAARKQGECPLLQAHPPCETWCINSSGVRAMQGKEILVPSCRTSQAHLERTSKESADEIETAIPNAEPGLIIPNILFINLEWNGHIHLELLPRAISPGICHVGKPCQFLPSNESVRTAQCCSEREQPIIQPHPRREGHRVCWIKVT